MIDTPVVVVTGASRGLEVAVAKWLGVLQANVVLVAKGGFARFGGRRWDPIRRHAVEINLTGPFCMAPAKAMLGFSLPLKSAYNI